MTDPKQVKRFTIITRSAPYGCNRPQLSLDIALAASVFEQKVSYVFLGDGVYQLLDGQNAECIQSKTLGSALETLDLYGIEDVIVDAQSLRERGLADSDLLISARSVEVEELAELLQKSDLVFNL